MVLAQPPIFYLSTDYAKFGLTLDQARRILDNRFVNRYDPNSGVTGDAEFIVLHIQDGTTFGSLDWWADGPGVQASCTAMVQKDGSILMIIPVEHGPWTNGDVNQPKPESADLIAKPGNKNIWCLTIEAEGRPFVEMPQVQLNSIAWLCMQWQGMFPIITNDRIERHGTISSVTRANCGLYRDKIIEIINAQQSSPTYTPPLVLPETMYPLIATVEALKDVVPRAWAESNAPRTGPNIVPRTKVQIKGEVKNKQGQQWFLLNDNSRVRASSFTPQISVKPR
jgi:hypothetical protein